MREAGYDGIELHAAHGYMLLGSFLSPWRNKRGDEYGGRKREGRLRFLLEVLAAIRREVGADFPITLRISGYERIAGRPPDRRHGADRAAARGGGRRRVPCLGRRDRPAHLDDRHGLALGRGAQPRRGDRREERRRRARDDGRPDPRSRARRGDPPARRSRPDRDGAARCSPTPSCPTKLRTRRRTQIRPCISCENCIDSMESANMSCAVNGLSGREGELSLAPRRDSEARRRRRRRAGRARGCAARRAARPPRHAIRARAPARRLARLRRDGAPRERAVPRVPAARGGAAADRGPARPRALARGRARARARRGGGGDGRARGGAGDPRRGPPPRDECSTAARACAACGALAHSSAAARGDARLPAVRQARGGGRRRPRRARARRAARAARAPRRRSWSAATGSRPRSA